MTVKASSSVPPTLRFGVFELDPKAGELRKKGMKIRLQGQPVDILVMLLQRPGETVTREELQKNLWPADTFVDFEQGLNNAMKRLRAALDDDAESPHFIETLPRRGYRFIAPVEGAEVGKTPVEVLNGGVPKHASKRPWTLRLAILFGACVLLIGTGFFVYERRQVSGPPKQRTLTRVTFDDGLQIGATWSPDGRFIAYSSDRGGKFDIWVKQVSGGDPVQITKGPGHNWQPDWSPDGKYIAYRSESDSGGLFVVPSLGGEGLKRKISSFGYYPRWSPDSSQILFRTHFVKIDVTERFFLVGLDGSTPREVLRELVSQGKLEAVSAAWHHDGKRISVLGRGPGRLSIFSTVPVTGGAALRSEVSPEIVNQIGEVPAGPETFYGIDPKFSWAPSGKAIYLGRMIRGALNLWKLAINPDTFRATAIERLTTGSGPDTELSVSADGRRLAFTEKTLRIRAWLFPFDATRGRVTGAGHAVTSPGVEAWTPDLSRDGKKLVFEGIRAGKSDVWEKSLVDGREAPIVADDYERHNPLWSPDGARLAYRRFNPSTRESQIMVWSGESHNEEPLTKLSSTDKNAYDWSPDGKRILLTLENNDQRSEIWQLPVAGAEAPQTSAAQKIISDTGFDLWQPHFSPDGKWIVFEAVTNSTQHLESILFVMPAAGGPWTRILGGKNWDDKPRWSPNGKTIYFVSNEGGYFNVWGIRFDPSKGKAVGEPFRVTAFENPSLMVPNAIEAVELSVTQDKLAITVQEQSGSIWVLDNVDR